MVGMSTPEHHYTFEVTRPAPSSIAADSFERLQVGRDAGSPGEAYQLLGRDYPTATLFELRLVSPIGDGCGDERCAVCNPSSRNRGTL